MTSIFIRHMQPNLRDLKKHSSAAAAAAAAAAADYDDNGDLCIYRRLV